MTITINHILGLCTALVLFANVYEKYNNIFGKKSKQLKSDVKTLKYKCDQHEKEINAQKQESKILCKGILACLRGLEEQGCDGPVKQGIAELETHLLNSSH